MTLQKFKIKDRSLELRGQLESQRDQLPPQTQLLLTSMIQLMELIIMIFEERLTPKNSRNSLPPSKDQRRKAAYRREQQKKTITSPKSLEVSEPDEVIDHHPDFCHHCGLELEDYQSEGFEARQVLDIVVDTYVTEHRSHQKECPCCGEHTQASFPTGIVGKVQYGPMVKALGISMLYTPR